ncbi:MAG TPA: polysaccharide deacetylase family protein [Candidatus Limnocylindrales bacterium]
MKATRFLAVHLDRVGLRRRIAKEAWVALPIVVLLVAAGAAQTVAAGPRSGSIPEPQGVPGASGIGAAMSPDATTVALPVPTPTSAPNLTVPEQTRRTTVLAPKPGAEYWTGSKSRNEIYITIDDCRWWETVDKDLEIARSKGVQLTLFPAGRFVDNDPSAAARVLQKAVSYGDEIDNHTYTHSFVDGEREVDIEADLAHQTRVVRSALKDPNYQEWFVRTPYGSGMGDPNLINAATADGLAIVRWSIDTKGYMAGATVDSVMHRVLDKFFKPGAIILMHDDITDMKALPLIIDKIREKGFEVGGPLKNILINEGDPVAGVGAGSRETAASSGEVVMGREDGPFA